MQTVALGGKLARGRVALVDDADYELVCQYSWHIYEVDRGPGYRPLGPYAQTNLPAGANGRRKTLKMHILILGIRTGIDHADGNGLNNQRSNLRPAGSALNNANAKPRVTTTKASRFKGVNRHACGKWIARLRARSLGLFWTEVAAARAYDIAALNLWGEFARPNFPRPDYEQTDTGWRLRQKPH